MEYEIDPPHLGKDRTKTQEISESLSPETKLRRRKNNNVKAIKRLNFLFSLTWQANVTHRGSVDGKTKNVTEI